LLSKKSTATVQATLPVVGGAIDEITERFYPRMFAAHPELLRDLFNRGNQAAGTQRQALAGSIAAFATHLVQSPGSRPDAILSRIAHKHAALGVTAEQYRIVHEHLFAAIVEVLGDAVTPEVAEAWDEVYWLMANALIALETRLYSERGCVPGGVWGEWEVVDRQEETADVASFVLRPADGLTPQPFQAGQYVSVQVALPDGANQIRQYSLCSAPDAEIRQISVKRERGDGQGTPEGEVSTFLHESVQVGDILRVSAPFGDLVHDGTDRPLVLASAGIGVTPMLSLLAELAGRDHQSPVLVVHADRSPADHALREEQSARAGKLRSARTYYWYEQGSVDDGESRIGLADITDLDIPDGTAAFLCGPLPFMRAMREQLLAKGVAAADIHYEVFGPDLWLATT
jgi:nitric oxide dioxygenase